MDFSLVRAGGIPGDPMDEIGYGWQYGGISEVQFWGMSGEIAGAQVFQLAGWDPATGIPEYTKLADAVVSEIN